MCCDNIKMFQSVHMVEYNQRNEATKHLALVKLTGFIRHACYIVEKVLILDKVRLLDCNMVKFSRGSNKTQLAIYLLLVVCHIGTFNYQFRSNQRDDFIRAEIHKVDSCFSSDTPLDSKLGTEIYNLLQVKVETREASTVIFP